MKMLLLLWGLLGPCWGGDCDSLSVSRSPVVYQDGGGGSQDGFGHSQAVVDGLQTVISQSQAIVDDRKPSISQNQATVVVDGLGFEEAVLVLSGASCVEELSEEELARWEALAAHPVNLNVAGRSRLMASGLLSVFQVASLLDYRGRSGAVLSWSELALVDGFSASVVEALRLFATLGSEGFVPGQRETLRLTGSLTLRGFTRATLPAKSTPSSSSRLAETSTSFPSTGNAANSSYQYYALAEASWSWAGGVKLEAIAGERVALYFSARSTLSDTRFGSPTFSAAYYGRRALGQVVIGHFNARFGQGLVLWSGFRMSGYSSVGAFRRNGNGFSPTGSYSPSLLGVATDWHFGLWRLSAGYSINNKLPILNLTRTGRTSSLGLTATSEAAGFEARWSLPGGWSLFSEVASNWKRLSSAGGSGNAVGSGVGSSAFGAWLQTLSAVAGAVRVPSYGYKWALLGRWFAPGSKEYSGLALGYSGPSLETTLDVGVKMPGAGSSVGSALVGGDVPFADWLSSGGQLQIKSVTQWKPVLALSDGRLEMVSGNSSDTPAAGTLLLRPQLRLVARWRPEVSPATSSSVAFSSTLLTSHSTSLLSSFPVTRSIGIIPSFPVSSSSSSSSPSALSPPTGIPGLRLELRGVLTAEYGPWVLSGRYDAVWFRDFAWNWYAEAGFRTDALKVWLRGGIFKVDDWDDRIYVYERDAPGSFTVPARYGRGWDASLYAAWDLGRPSRPSSASNPGSGNSLASSGSAPARSGASPSSGGPAAAPSFGGPSAPPRRFSPRHSLWLRVETVRYPWNLSPKPARLEARLQYRLKW